MNVLTQKDEKWRWEEPQQEAFDELKRVFTTKPVLAAPDLDKEFRVEADASNYATGGVLSMKCSNEKLTKYVLENLFTFHHFSSVSLCSRMRDIQK